MDKDTLLFEGDEDLLEFVLNHLLTLLKSKSHQICCLLDNCIRKSNTGTVNPPPLQLHLDSKKLFYNRLSLPYCVENNYVSIFSNKRNRFDKV